MCLIFLSVNDHPDYKLIVVANRDEFYNRQTQGAHFWKDHPEVLAGRDLRAGGTWMGVSKTGNVSMVTNYRDPKNIDPQAPSRGHLVSNYLCGSQPAPKFLQQIKDNGKRCNGFNLIAGTADALYYYSNYKNTIDPIAPGIHGLSNHLLDTAWPKVTRGLDIMKSLMRAPSPSSDDLLNAMRDTDPAADNALPNTGLTLDKERALSSIFIKSEGYGSRSSTVLMVDKADSVTFIERIYNLETFEYSTHEFNFQVEGVSS